MSSLRTMMFVVFASLGAIVSVAANAAVLTSAYDFRADFARGPYTSIFGSILMTYDPLIAGQVVVSSFTSPQLQNYNAGAFVFESSGIAFGNCEVPSCRAQSGQSQFFANFRTDDRGNVISSYNLTYSTGSPGVFRSTAFSVTRQVPPIPMIPAVPETATWAMMLVGFAAIGSALRKRQVPHIIGLP